MFNSIKPDALTKNKAIQSGTVIKPTSIAKSAPAPHIFPIPNGMLVAGDSRAAGFTNLGLTASYSSSTIHNSSSCFDWVPQHSGQVFYVSPSSNYGVSGSTSLSLFYRTNTLSIASTGNPANAITGVSQDNPYNTKNTGNYSLVSHPVNTVFIICSTNDTTGPSYYVSPLLGMIPIAKTLDLLSHKTVFLANEMPKGTGISCHESHAVSSNSCTATNTTGFEDASALGIPAVFNGTTGAIYTKVASGPAVGQYSVNSSGVYSFNASDTITTALVSYTYTATGSSSYLITMHNWLQSSDPIFVDPSSGITYPIAGALYKRPWVVSVDTWGTLVDPNVANTPKRGTVKDGIHSTSYGGQLIAKNAIVPKIRQLWPNLPTIAYSPTRNNQKIATGNGSTSAYSVTLPSTMLPVPQGSLKIFTGTSGGAVGVDNGSGSITGTGISSGTINYSTGALSVTFSSNVGNSVSIFAYCDPRNALDNGLMDPSPILGSNTPTGTGASGTVPAPWTGLCTNMGGVTATFSTTTDDEGYPAVQIVLTTATGVTGTGPVCRLSSGTITQAAQQIVASGPWMACANIKISAGPDGHLYGLTGVSSTVGINPANGSKPGQASVTNFTLNGNQGTANITLTDLDLLPGGGSIKYTACTPVFDLTGFTSMSGTVNFTANMATNWAVSATVLISRVAFYQTPGASFET